MSENKDTTISLPCLSIHLYLPQSNTMELNTVIFTVLTQINNIDFYLNMQRNMSLISGFPVFPVTSFFRLMIQLFSIVDENLWKFYTNYHFNGTVFFYQRDIGFICWTFNLHLEIISWGITESRIEKTFLTLQGLPQKKILQQKKKIERLKWSV